VGIYLGFFFEITYCLVDDIFELASQADDTYASKSAFYHFDWFHCGHQVVKDVIQLLRTELDAYKSNGSRQSLAVLRQGLLVLRALAVSAIAGNSQTFDSHYASIRDDFMLLMSGVVRLFRHRVLSIPEHESMCMCLLS